MAFADVIEEKRLQPALTLARPAMDVSALVALESALLRLRRQGVITLIAGARPQPLSVLQRAGIRDEPGKLQFCVSLEEAVRAAAEITRS